MKRAVMWLLVAVLGAAFVYCGYRYYRDVYIPNKQITDADSAQRELFGSVKPSAEKFRQAAEKPAPEGEEVSPQAAEPENSPLAELKEANGDAVGWLTIDGTNIDYPIVQAADNSFYLQNGFDKKYNSGLGCPFLDSRCDSGFKGFNSIVYAHHIKGDKAMFGDIAKYADSGFIQQHPAGKLLTADGAHDVRFFAYITIPSTGFVYETGLEEKPEKDGYIDALFGSANYTYGIAADELKEKDGLRLLLLSTCTYEYWEARGVLAGVVE